ncbi:MAG: hypothetical protein QXO69_01135 [archaeon]
MPISRAFALFIMLLATPLAVVTLEHDVILKVNSDNSASVTERYLLGLNENETALFNKISESNVNSITEWQKLLPGMNAYVLGETPSFQISTSTASGGQFGNEVKIEYSIVNFSSKVETSGRYEVYRINGTQFRFYDANTGIFSIGSADLTIILPDEVTSANILETTPKPWISSGNSLRWISGTSTNSFTVVYRKEIKISESFDFNRLIETYFVKNPFYGGLIVAVVIVSIAYRKQIISLISESFSSEEEIQPPKRES